jgi:hypothetical protein
MMAGHEMRRVQEIYPSFDTRRVLCKQQRNYCVKPMRAGRKPSIANAVASSLSANRAKNFVAIAQVSAGRIEETNIKKNTELLINTRHIAGHTIKLITGTFAKNKERGTMLTTGQHHIYAPAKFAMNNTSQEYHLARFVQNNVKSTTPLRGLGLITQPPLCKGGSKSANTGSATPIRLRLTETIVQSCHTSGSWRHCEQE